MRIILFIHFISLCCFPSSAETNDWQKADEGSFTLEIPKLLEKQIVHPIDSHCGIYSSPHMELNFDEVGLMYAKKEAKARHNEFKKGYRKQKGMPIGPQFFLKLGERYAKVVVSSDEQRVKEHYPGKYEVEFFCPNPPGSYLSIWIIYRDEQDTDTALRIIKSVQTQ